MIKVTKFQSKVYDAIKLIPRGKVTTYKLLGNFLDCNSAQAIGQALKKNPFAPEVPCHRVIKTDLTIGGYSGQVKGEKIVRKLTLLKEEGVIFSQDGKLTNEDQIYTYEEK